MRILTLLLILAAPAAHAIGVHFDPYISGSMGKWATDRAQVGIETEMHGQYSGYGYGAKLALSYKFIFVGYEYGQRELIWLYNKMPAEPADDNWEGRVKGKNRVAGPLIGFKNRASTWFVYYSMFNIDELTFDKDQDPTEPVPSYKGKSTNIGFAFTLGKWVKAGFEYQRKEYDRLSQEGQNVTLPGLGLGGTYFSTLKREEYLGYLSIPFVFFEK